MESSLKDLFETLLKDKLNKDDIKEILESKTDLIDKFVKEYEDPDIHIRCLGKNKNGKRCLKPRKENSEYCAIHSNQQKDKDIDFVLTDTLEKPKQDIPSITKSIQILETNKKKGILPEKIKKIVYDGKKYYTNKNDWIYEMDQSSELILSDIPIGKLFSGKLILLKIEEI